MPRPQLRADFFVAADGTITPKAPPLKRSLALAIYRRDGGTCRACGQIVKFGGVHASPYEEIRSGQIDHIFPRARGGQNVEENLQLLCLTCNSRKGTRG